MRATEERHADGDVWIHTYLLTFPFIDLFFAAYNAFQSAAPGASRNPIKRSAMQEDVYVNLYQSMKDNSDAWESFLSAPDNVKFAGRAVREQ